MTLAERPQRSTTLGSAKPDASRHLLDVQRDRAERLINVLRGAMLGLLALAALAYAPRLSHRLQLVNMLVLVPMLLWTVGQYLLFYRRPRLPGWLAVANPVVDITAVSAILTGYGLVESTALALKSPMFLAYFAILAARPIASSARRAAAVSGLAVVAYAAVVAAFLASGRVELVSSPLAASTGGGTSLLDEGAKLLFLLVGGGIATYATAWHERLATSYYREAREREQMEVRLAATQLENLKMQLHPHFLFNTLNTILALISSQPRTAERMVSGLSELLRVSLHGAANQLVSLERELDLLRPYLDIQQVRFQDRLRISLVIAPDTRRALVPSLLLQPLVENAIRHGIAPRACAGHVEVRAERTNGVLHLRVADDGVGLGASRAAREGVGLGNTRARLMHLYGPNHRLDVRGGEAGGCTVEIELPYEPESTPDRAQEGVS